MLTIGLYQEIRILWEGYNPKFLDQVYDLELDNGFEIHDFYEEKGYYPMWIGKLSNKIYVRASKKIQFPCVDTGRYDLFSIDGMHLREIKNFNNIPKVKYHTTDTSNEYIFLHSEFR